MLALAGVGGDAHSVGLIVLSRSLARAGFQVSYLATQNNLPDLCAAVVGADAILISNMDGHARYYLRDLPYYQDAFGVRGRLWYLGGHPCLPADEDTLPALRTLGFDRVFPGYVEPRQVIALLDADLAVTGDPGTGDAPDCPRAATIARLPPGRPADARTHGNPLDERELVLSQWHTGAGAADLERNAAELHERAWLSAAQDRADAQGRTLIHPRSGVSGAGAQQELLARLRAGGADVLSFQIDSLTRNNRYDEVERVLKDATADQADLSCLNGYPAVNHGVESLRRITSELPDIPFQVRHSTRDPRLLAEITFAGGIAAFEGGPITYNLPYYRNYDPRESLARWHYVDKLAGTYRERYGVVIDREFFGVLTASLVPPCVAVAVNVLEALLAAEAGVTSLSLGYAEQGNGPQDVAAIRALRRLAVQYLAQRSFGDVAVHTVFHQYMGAFPADPAKARVLLRGSAATAAASKATRLMLKTHVEALRIPSAEENVDSMNVVRNSLAAATPASPAWIATMRAEEELVIREASAILDAALRAGRESVPQAIVEGIRQGLIDIPFSPSLWNAGRAVTIRDSSGAVRFADPGSLPLPDDVREHHRGLVKSRVAAQRMPIEELIEYDVLRIARGWFDEWPLR